MINKKFDSIDKSDIELLITNEVVEHKTVDYKEDLIGGTDDNKREFLADVVVLKM
jgi:hypothetical protein